MSESRFIDQTDKKWFWSHLNNENEVGEVCQYLEDNNLKIEIKGDRSGGWEGDGIRIILEGIDLSGNGFCFNGGNLLFHVRYFRKAKIFAETKEFKDWLEKHEAYDQIRQYIIEKDQRWLKSDKIRKCFNEA